MRIKDFADEKGLTKQAVYKAIQRAGFSTKQLTDRQGNITPKGFAVLRNLFPDVPGQPAEESDEAPEQAAPRQSPLQPELDRLQQIVSELENRCAEWEKRCMEWERRYFDAVDSAKKEAEQMRVLLSQEQQLRLAAENKGFFRRLFAGKKTDE